MSERRGAVALMLVCATLIGLRAASLLYDHSLHSIDGAMQTWFALANFADGEQLGVAFQSYLGVTMILALLPLFWAFGGTLYASTLAAYTAVAIGVFASAYALAWMMRWVAPRERWALALLLVFVFYLVGPLVADAIGLRYPLGFDPGVSLRPLRGALPVFVLPVFVWALRRIRADGSSTAALILGAVAGLGLLWSNDAGIPLVLALVIVLIAALFRKAALLARTLALFMTGTIASAIATLMAVTHGSPGGWLQYNFRDVAGDQIWYFAPWDRASRILSPLDLPRILTGGDPLTTLGLIILVACVLIALAKLAVERGSPVRMAGFAFVGASTVGTALIPQIGGHIDGAYNNITFMIGLAGPAVVFPRLASRLARPVGHSLGKKGLVVAAGVAALLMVGFSATNTMRVLSETDRTYYARNLGFHVTPEQATELRAMERLARFWDEIGVSNDQQLLSVYTSVLDIAAGAQSPEPVGSLIHALGDRNRASFTAQVEWQNVAAVTTIAPDYSGWEGWNTRANWPFFKALRDYYHPIARTDQHILWVAGGGKFAKSDAACKVLHLTNDRTEITITSETAGLASIRLNRSSFATGRTAILTVIEESPFTRSARKPAWSDFPRYGVANAETVEVPAPVEAGTPTTLTLEVLDGSAIGSAQCSATVYEPIDFAALPGLPEGVDAYIAKASR